MSETLAQYQTTSQDIVNLAAMSLSAAPDLTEAERATRFQTVVRGTMEFHPADSAQTIVASLILGHYLAIMDGFRVLACPTLSPVEATRARMFTVARTKLVLQLLREVRIERKDALTRAAAEAIVTQRAEPVPGPALGPIGDAAYEAPFDASLAKFMSAYTESLSAMENMDTVTPAAAAKAREALSQAVPPALLATPGAANPVEANPVPVTGNRALRRAMMKRNGSFKRTN